MDESISATSKTSATFLENIHSTATSRIVAVPKQSAKTGRDHVAAATSQKLNAVSHGLNVVDARLKD
ncbi:hypothetical protein MKX08_005731 [Trichoderma sp. CBMAI-0020]|nr:hypothetical protein MKX08_005731 [Trichoderma sp. CBMAI-0020]